VGEKSLVLRESASTGTHETITKDIQNGMIAA
jgi:hypothetical protein